MVKDPTRIFFWIRFFPTSLVFGLHFLILFVFLQGNQKKGGKLALALFCFKISCTLAWIICFALFSSTQDEYQSVCCYPNQQPVSNAQYSMGGACNTPGSLMYADGDHSACANWPTKSILYFGLGMLFLVVSLGANIAGDSYYCKHIQIHLESSARDFGFTEKNGKYLYKSAQLLAYYPECVLFAIHNMAIGEIDVFVGNTVLVVGTSGLSVAVSVVRTLHLFWGCYPLHTPISQLNKGYCNDPTSAIFIATDGVYEPSNTLMALMLFTAVTGLLWLFLYFVSTTGLHGKNNNPWIRPFGARFVKHLLCFAKYRLQQKEEEEEAAKAALSST